MKIKKTYEVSGDGRIRVYPSLYEKEDESTFRRFLRKLLLFISR